MPTLTQEAMRQRARRVASEQGQGVEELLERRSLSRLEAYDIFLSQTINDAEIVLGIYDLLTSMGLTVFCDWISSPELSRETVSPHNADFLRHTMGRSASLLFVDSQSADESVWMSWELGWFDGHDGHVAVLPVLVDECSSYRGREFLGLYPYIVVDENNVLSVVRPYATNQHGVSLFEAPNTTTFDRWKHGDASYMRPRDIEHLVE